LVIAACLVVHGKLQQPMLQDAVTLSRAEAAAEAAAAAPSSSSAVLPKEGILLKQGANWLDRYRRRRVKITESGEFKYFKKNCSLAGRLELYSARLLLSDSKFPHAFTLVCAADSNHRQTFELAAESAAERVAWMAALKEAIARRPMVPLEYTMVDFVDDIDDVGCIIA